MLQVVYEERGLTLRDMTFSKARDMIEIMKLKERRTTTATCWPCRSRACGGSTSMRRPRRTSSSTATSTRRRSAGLDYNDLIVFVLHLFEQNPDIRSKWQRRLEYVMVDEFQDIDGLQHELMEVLAGYHKNLFVVGDPDQTIYTWRGRRRALPAGLRQAFPGTHTVMMLENYRSAPRVVAVANSLIEKNRERMPKRLVAARSTHGPTVWHHAKSSADEAAWIAQGALALHGEGVAYRDMAVLYRAHYASRPVEEALLRAEVPHAVHSGVPFFGRREIKDALSYLRLVAYRDDLDFARVANVPKRNLGQRRMAFPAQQADEWGCSLIEALARSVDDELFKRTKARQLLDLDRSLPLVVRGRPVSEVLAAVLSESGYERMLRTEGGQERLDNLAELKQSIYEFGNHVRGRGDPRALPGPRGPALERRRDGRCAGQGAAHDRPRGEGPRVPARVPLLDERGRAPVAQDEHAAGHGGGAPPGVRGHDPGARRAVPHRGGGRSRGRAALPSRFLLDIDPAALEFSNKPSDGQIADARAAYALTDRWIADLVRDARFSGGRPRGARGVRRGARGGRRHRQARLRGGVRRHGHARTISFKAKLEKA